jgi:ABC transport system ATP-binding/permease protein
MDGISKTLADSPLFEGLSLGIDEGERIGLVGGNGAGKSTLLRVILGELETDSGSIARKRGLRLSCLEQRPQFQTGCRLKDFLLDGKATDLPAYRRYLELSENHGSGAELERLRHALESSGGMDLERRYLSLCTELGLPDPDAALDSFSGGMLKKAAIARALAPASDLVLLDEPTNHLDIETIEWLEKRLISGGFAFILVTHDRWFLDSVCQSILEVEGGKVYRHEGNYSDYLESKAERLAVLEKADSRRVAKLRIELEWLGRGARARAGKSRRRKEKIRDMAQDGLERGQAMSAFQSGEARLGRKVLELKGVSKAYGPEPLFSSLSYEFTRGDRVGVVGPNGVGKTSLLDLLAGRSQPDSGMIARGDTLRVAYFDQESSNLDPDSSVIDCVREHAEVLKLRDGTSLSAEQLLERFLFPRDFQGLKIGRLSGGERRRLGLVRLLAESPNFLILDEPTNDLDIETIELLEDFLEGFPGCVVAVSHDRAFLDRMAGFLLVFDGQGGLREFAGSYSEWREALADQEGQSGEAAGRQAPARKGSEPDGSESAGTAARKRRLSFAEKKEFDALLGTIEALEAEKADLESFFSGSSHEGLELEKAKRRYAELASLIEAKTVRWEELAELA